MITQFNNANLPSWQINLIRKYPGIYLEPNPFISKFCTPEEAQEMTSKENYCNLRYGFEFCEGWKQLADHFSNITTHFVSKLRESGAQENAWVKACVFKQKMGMMRWKGSNNLNEPFRSVYQGFVASVEMQSQFICELTGAQGKIRNIDGNLICLGDQMDAQVRQNPSLLSWKSQFFDGFTERGGKIQEGRASASKSN